MELHDTADAREPGHSWEFVGRFGALSRDMLTAVLDQSADCVKILDPEGGVDFMNRNGLCAMEIDDFSAIAGRAWTTLWPKDSTDTLAEAVAAAQAGRASRFEAFCPTAKGTPKWWDVAVSPVRRDDGTLFAILAVSRDVTAQRQALDSMETMAFEMRHRLRNAYAVSGAIALASGREEPDHAEFSADLAQRLNSLSTVQSSLMDPSGGERLPALVARIIAGFDGANGLIATADLPDAELDDREVRLLALVLGELATNSLKHGALKAGMPVRIGGPLVGERPAIEWREALGNDARLSPSEGSGHRLMERMARAHGGNFSAEIVSGALVARLELPA